MRAIEIIGCGLAAFIVLAGALARWMQAWGCRRDRRRYPPPGETIAIDRGRFHLYRLDWRDRTAAAAEGAAAPTVVFEAALGGSSLGWFLVQEEVARFAPTVSYDRAGMGYSDAGPMPRTIERGAAELHQLLATAGVPPPYVLVGHSYGGLLARLYAAHYPEEIRGLVLVDAPTPMQWANPTDYDRRRLAIGAALSRRGAWAARWGVARLAAGLASLGALRLARGTATLVSGGRLGPGAEAIFGPAMRLPERMRPALRACWLQPKFYEALASQMETLIEGARAVERAGVRATLPLRVLTATQPAPDRYLEQEQLTAMSRQGRHQIADASGHWIPLEEPALVVAAIHDLIHAAGNPAAG